MHTMIHTEDIKNDAPATWSAKCTPEVMAMEIVADLCKKFRQLNAVPPETFEVIAQGMVDGLKDTTFPHPSGSHIPNYRRSMDRGYCAGFDVGHTWRKIAQEWPRNTGTTTL